MMLFSDCHIFFISVMRKEETMSGTERFPSGDRNHEKICFKGTNYFSWVWFLVRGIIFTTSKTV